jgi:hypothetical protein
MPLVKQMAVPQLRWMFTVVMHDRPVPQSASAEHALLQEAKSAKLLSQMPELVATLVSQKQSAEQPPAPLISVPGSLHGGGPVGGAWTTRVTVGKMVLHGLSVEVSCCSSAMRTVWRSPSH